MAIRTFFMFISIFAILTVKAQSLPDLSKNEFKLNGLYLVEGTLELSYERWVGRRLGIGLSSYISLRGDGMKLFGESLPWNFSITPFLRIYIGGSGYKGFFIEGNLMLGSNTEVLEDIGDGNNTAWDLGGGMAYGAKWVFGRNWGVEAYAGLGVTTNLYEDPKPQYFFDWTTGELVYPRCGISVIKRF